MTQTESPSILVMLLEDWLTEVRVIRSKRVPARVRMKRKRYYRKRKARIKRLSRVRRRKPRSKRMAKRRAKIRKRMHIRPGSRRRIRLASAERFGNITEGRSVGQTKDLIRGFENVVKLVESLSQVVGSKKLNESISKKTLHDDFFPAELPSFEQETMRLHEDFEGILGIKKEKKVESTSPDFKSLKGDALALIDNLKTGKISEDEAHQVLTFMTESLDSAVESVVKESKEKVIKVKLKGWDYDLKITDSTHFVMKDVRDERWGIPMHVQQLYPEVKKQLQDQGYMTGDGYFVWSEPSESVVKESGEAEGEDETAQGSYEKHGLEPMMKKLAAHPAKLIKKVKSDDGEQVVKVMKVTHPTHKSLIGIHLEDPSEAEIEDAIETAMKDGFEYVWVHHSEKLNQSVVKESGPIKEGSESDYIAEEIAKTWACDQIASVVENEQTDLLRDFVRSQEDILETVPMALEDVGLHIEDFLAFDAAKKLIDKINKEWAGKLTVEELCAEFESAPHYIAMQAHGHGTGVWDQDDMMELIKSKGIDIRLGFQSRAEEAGFEQALEAVDAYKEKLAKEAQEESKSLNTEAKKALKRKQQLREKDIVHENGDCWVADEGDAYTVYKTGVTHSVSDSSYAHDEDGLSIAKARCDYLAKRAAQKSESSNPETRNLGEADPSLQPPKRWFNKMVKQVKGDDPAAIVGRIWADLPDSKKKEIRAREGKTYGPAESVSEAKDPIYVVVKDKDGKVTQRMDGVEFLKALQMPKSASLADAVKKYNDSHSEKAEIAVKGMKESMNEESSAKDFEEPFELTDSLKARLEKLGHMDDIEVLPKGEEDDEQMAKIKSEVAKELARTENLFLYGSENHGGDKYFNDAKAIAKEFTEERIKKLAGDRAGEFEVEVTGRTQDRYVGSDAGALYVTIRLGDQEEEMEPAALYYSGASESAQDSVNNSDWNWLFWLYDHDSPHSSDTFREMYEYDQIAQALEQFASTLGETDYPFELEKVVKKMLENQEPTDESKKYKKEDSMGGGPYPEGEQRAMDLINQSSESNAEMAKADVVNIHRKAQAAHDYMKELSDIPPWVVAKVAMMKAGMNSVIDYVAPKTKEGNKIEDKDNKETVADGLSNLVRKAQYLSDLMKEVAEVPAWVLEKLSMIRGGVGSIMDWVAPQTSANPVKEPEAEGADVAYVPGTARAMRGIPEAKQVVARWESKSGKHWVELCQYDDGGFGYKAPDGGGVMAAKTMEDAVAELQKKIDSGYFLPDDAKTPMKRVEVKQEDAPVPGQQKAMVSAVDVTPGEQRGMIAADKEKIRALKPKKPAMSAKLGEKTVGIEEAVHGSTPRVYVGTYAKYNSGSIEGKWLDLEDYADKEDFLVACKELHKDEEDPELMFQDFEGFPEEYYSESSLSDELWDWLELDEDDRELLAVYQDEVIGAGGKADIDEAREAFAGKAKSEGDWAYDFIEEMGGLKELPEEQLVHFLSLSETDIRVMAVDEASSRVSDMSDAEVVEEAGMEDEYDAAMEAEDEDKAEKIVADARDQVDSKISDDIQSELEKDPVGYFVDTLGYSVSDLAKGNIMSFDYDAYAREMRIAGDYTFVRKDGEVWVFRSV